MLKKLARVRNQGSSKNLEIIFCEHKFQDFVKRSNEQLRALFDS
jgi:hypothetical protein